ncbi:MAG: hypothetical protein ACI8WM_000150 [Burkholderiaceae bacterium]|jgi:hypothetical protein
MNEQVTSSSSSNAFWDEWQLAAIEAGVATPLAELGCEIMRTHRKNRWSKDFLGVEDDGPVMLEMCLTEPAEAEMLFIENLHPYNTALLEATRLRLGF